MKFKLDENLGPRIADVVASAGHDVHTVPQERLSGCSDEDIYRVCAAEGRCLVTLDLDFADVVRFSPGRGPGIAVLRTSRTVSTKVLAELVNTLLAALDREPIAGRLWVVEVGRIRTYERDAIG